MRKRLCSALLALLIPATAAAQSQRDDGIRAFIAGDYARAARLLGPLADNADAPDSVAAFLMAMLYEQGRDVGRNGFRACGLYLKAAATPGPFTEQAVQLVRLMREEWGSAGAEFCKANAQWRTSHPATFVLGADHSVEIMSDRMVVRYRGEEKRVMTGMMPDVIPLPTRYTPVDVTQPVRARRHFLEACMWWRDTSASWALGCVPYEIVGVDLLPTPGEKSLMSITAAEPPASVDLAALARVRVNEHGEAEWVIGGSTNPRTAALPWRGPK